MNKEQTYKEIENYYRRSFKNLVKINMNRVGGYHAAEDVVQEAFTRALTYWKSYEPEMHTIDKWFSRILENVVRSHNKTERMRGAVVDVDDVVLGSFSPNPFFTILLDNIKSDILELGGQTAYIGRLSLLDGFNPRDISAITSLTPNAVSQTIFRVKEVLRQKYGEQLYA